MIPAQPHQPRERGTSHRQSYRGWAGLLFALAVVILACGTTSATQGDTGATGAATSTLATITPSTSATATPAAPTATPHSATAPTATPTPIPPLQAQILVKPMYNVAAGANSSVDAVCPSGYLVAGGGISSGDTTFTIMWNAPINTTTWRGEIHNTGSGTINPQLQVVCIASGGLHSQIITSSAMNVSAGAMGGATLNCPAGYFAAGGGTNSGYTTFNDMWNAPTSTSSWRGEIYNTGISTIIVQFQAVCLAAPGLQSQIIYHSFSSVAANSNSPISDMTCPAGYLATGGGMNTGYTTFVEMDSAPTSTTNWRVEAFNTGSSAVSTQFQVACMKR
jgi:hypothetical protein